jgi:hypothetical protein
MEGTVTFGVTNFAWVPSYVFSVPLGGALVDPRDDAIFLSLTVVCLMMLLLLRRVACRASD